MKKVSTETTGLLSLILLISVSVFAFGELIFSLLAAPTVLGWLESAHVSFYSNTTAISAKMIEFIMDKSFQNMFSLSYIRIMAMYIFVLCTPLIYALFNIYFISKNGQSKKPFRSSTSACLRSITIAFIAEFALSTVLFIILKIIIKPLPFYFMYAMLAVALYSLVIIVFSMTISGLINRMGTLRNEHAKQVRQKKMEIAKAMSEEVPVIPDFNDGAPSIKDRVSEILGGSKLGTEQPEQEKEEPKKEFSSNFDDVLSSIGESTSKPAEKIEEEKTQQPEPEIEEKSE